MVEVVTRNGRFNITKSLYEAIKKNNSNILLESLADNEKEYILGLFKRVISNKTTSKDEEDLKDYPKGMARTIVDKFYSPMMNDKDKDFFNEYRGKLESKIKGNIDKRDKSQLQTLYKDIKYNKLSYYTEYQEKIKDSFEYRDNVRFRNLINKCKDSGVESLSDEELKFMQKCEDYGYVNTDKEVYGGTQERQDIVDEIKVAIDERHKEQRGIVRDALKNLPNINNKDLLDFNKDNPYLSNTEREALKRKLEYINSGQEKKDREEYEKHMPSDKKDENKVVEMRTFKTLQDVVNDWRTKGPLYNEIQQMFQLKEKALQTFVNTLKEMGIPATISQTSNLNNIYTTDVNDIKQSKLKNVSSVNDNDNIQQKVANESYLNEAENVSSYRERKQIEQYGKNIQKALKKCLSQMNRISVKIKDNNLTDAQKNKLENKYAELENRKTQLERFLDDKDNNNPYSYQKMKNDIAYNDNDSNGIKLSNNKSEMDLEKNDRGFDIKGAVTQIAGGCTIVPVNRNRAQNCLDILNVETRISQGSYIDDMIKMAYNLFNNPSNFDEYDLKKYEAPFKKIFEHYYSNIVYEMLVNNNKKYDLIANTMRNGTSIPNGLYIKSFNAPKFWQIMETIITVINVNSKMVALTILMHPIFARGQKLGKTYGDAAKNLMSISN